MKNPFWVAWIANHTTHHFKSSRNTKSAYTKKLYKSSVHAGFKALFKAGKLKQSNRLPLGGVV